MNLEIQIDAEDKFIETSALYFDLENWSELKTQGTGALMICYRCLKDKRRAQGTPFIYHPLRVAAMLKGIYGIQNPRIILIGLLHDILEQNIAKAKPLIEEILGRNYVNDLQKLTKQHIALKRERSPDEDERYFAQLSTLSDDLIIVKLCDRLHNLQEIHMCDREKREKFLHGMKMFYLPLACDRGENNLIIKSLYWRLTREYQKSFQAYKDG